MHPLVAFVSLCVPVLSLLFDVLYTLSETLWRLRIKKKEKIAVE